MENHTFHKTVRYKGKGDKLEARLTPWKNTEMFNRKLLSDLRTGAIAKTSFKNNIVDGVMRSQVDIMKIPNVDRGLDKLKKVDLLKDFKVKSVTHQG